MVLLETPSRVWRRIDAAEGAEMPSLPSLPAFEDSAASEDTSNSDLDLDTNRRRNLSTVYSEPDEEEEDGLLPIHSTPGISSHQATARFGGTGPSSASSTARFAGSIASRSMNGNARSVGSHVFGSLSRGTSVSVVKGGDMGKERESFDISSIPSIHNRSSSTSSSKDSQDQEGHAERKNADENPHSLLRKSKDSVPDVYLPPPHEDQDQDLSLTEALESVSRASSPFPLDIDEVEHAHDRERAGKGAEETPKTKKKYDYSVSLRSEPMVRLFNMFDLF